MKLIPILLFATAMFASATDEENSTPKNLTVLKDTGKTFNEGMRAFRKGLGGDCNGCHTAQGANGAPGRVALP